MMRLIGVLFKMMAGIAVLAVGAAALYPWPTLRPKKIQKDQGPTCEATGEAERIAQSRGYKAEDPPGYDPIEYGHYARQGARGSDLPALKAKVDQAYLELQAAQRAGYRIDIEKAEKKYRAALAEFEQAKKQARR